MNPGLYRLCVGPLVPVAKLYSLRPIPFHPKFRADTGHSGEFWAIFVFTTILAGNSIHEVLNPTPSAQNCQKKLGICRQLCSGELHLKFPPTSPLIMYRQLLIRKQCLFKDQVRKYLNDSMQFIKYEPRLSS